MLHNNPIFKKVTILVFGIFLCFYGVYQSEQYKRYDKRYDIVIKQFSSYIERITGSRELKEVPFLLNPYREDIIYYSLLSYSLAGVLLILSLSNNSVIKHLFIITLYYAVDYELIFNHNPLVFGFRFLENCVLLISLIGASTCFFYSN